MKLVALRLVDLRGHPVDAAVDVGDQDDALAGVDEVHERRRRADPGAERDAVLRVLEARERVLERGARGVRDARVVVALVHADGLLHVRRRLVDRRDDRAGRRVGLLPDVDRARLEVHRRSLAARCARGRGCARAAWRRARASRRRCRARRGSAVKRRIRSTPSRAVGLEVGAAEEAVAREQRQHVVAVDPLVLALVDLDQVAGSRTAARAAAGPRPGCRTGRRAPAARGRRRAPCRRARRTARRRRRRRLRCSRPSATSASRWRCSRALPPFRRQCSRIAASVSAPRAADGEQRERAQRLVLARRRRVEQVLRDHALGEVVEPLEALAAGDRELARDPRAPRAPSSPASSSTSRRRRRCPRSRASRAALRPRIRSSTGSTRSACSRSARSCAPQWPAPSITGRKCGQSSIGSSTPRAPSTRRCARSAGAQAPCRGVRTDPRRERQAVRAVDGRDRVELHRGQPPDRVLDLVRDRAPEARRVALAARPRAGGSRRVGPSLGACASARGRGSRAGRSA